MRSGSGGNVVLTGFMGTGKTAVGKEVARRLDLPFVDMDEEIEARAGCTVAEIFSRYGEAAFRRLEADLAGELSEQCNRVIATGGGALVDDINRERLKRSGTVICLTCEPHEILRRVSHSSNPDRPLLLVADPHREVKRLLRIRGEAYAAIPWQIDTTRHSIDQVADRVMELIEKTTLKVSYPGGTYSIFVGTGLLSNAGGALRASGVPEGCNVAIVSNPVVAPLYADRVTEALDTAGLTSFTCLVPDGEQHKTLDTVRGLYGQFLAGGLDRGGAVLSLGGGVTGDIAGFAAASFMRGVRFAQIPTSLLAIVDASVGGKTGVDLPHGKNLVGAFKQPINVLVDSEVLASLPLAEYRSGMAEVIKHGIIGAPDLFAELEAAVDPLRHFDSSTRLTVSSSQIARALEVKVGIVEQDPFEQGRRAALNLGHTVGHALEQVSRYTLRHGEAVAIGMVAAARISASIGRCDVALPARIQSVLRGWGLPTEPMFSSPVNLDELLNAMAYDKKSRDKRLRWILPREIGTVEIVEDVPLAQVRYVLDGLWSRSIT